MLSLEIEQFILIKRVNKEFYKFGHSSLVARFFRCIFNSSNKPVYAVRDLSLMIIVYRLSSKSFYNL